MKGSICKKYKNLLDFVRCEDVVLFVGSGCSLTSKAPSVKLLGEIIASKLPKSYQNDLTGKSLANVAEAAVLYDPERKLLDEIIYQEFHDLEPSGFHKTLAKIPHIRTIITTNYDELIEKAYWQDYFQVICTDEELLSSKPQGVQLLKIHGDCKHLSDVIISDSDYRRFIISPKYKLLWNRVLNEFVSKHILFVGYSLEDSNILNMIEDIQSQVNPKSMFLVSPQLSRVQLKRLELLGVKYFQGYGEELLNNILSGLKYSFGDDLYNNVASSDTLYRFALLNNIIPTFEYNGSHTILKDYRSLTPSPCSLKLNFTTDDSNILLRRESVTCKELIDGFDIPAIRLRDDELSSIEILVNGLKINSENGIADVFLAPIIEDIQLGFISNSLGINIKKLVKKYHTDSKTVCCLSTPVYNAEFVFTKNSYLLNCQVDIHLNESFYNIEDAILWMKVLIGLVEANDMQLWADRLMLGSLSNIKGADRISTYKQWLQYCENLKQIELLGNSLFEKYEGYSYKSYEFSKIVKAYLASAVYVDKPNNRNRRFTCNLPKNSILRQDHYYVMRTVSELSEPIMLCGNTYVVPMERLLMLKCQVSLVDDTNDAYDIWEITNVADEVQYEYCDKDKPDQLIQGKVEKLS